MVKKVLTEIAAERIRQEPRFKGIERFNIQRVGSTSPTMYGDEPEYVEQAFQSGATGENADALEEEMARFIGVKHAIALSSGTTALHMAVRLAAEKVYGNRNRTGGSLCGRRVFCSDFTSAAIVDSVIYEGGEPVFIDASPCDWGMDPKVLEIAFREYPDVKIVVMAHLYGFPGQIQKLRKVCGKYGALLIEDACESLGATVNGKQTGSFGDYSVLSFNVDNIITGTGGGMLLTNDLHGLQSVQSREPEFSSTVLQYPYGKQGYGCRMSDVIAGLIRSQIRYLPENIAKKKAVYKLYQDRFSEDIMLLNPIGKDTEPNYWISCMTVESTLLFHEIRTEREYEYMSEHGTAAPMEILDALEAFGIGGKPVWKPMHMQPLFQDYDQITLDGSRRIQGNRFQDTIWMRSNESAYIFNNGLCLPSDIKMTQEEQERVIDIIYSCYNMQDMDRQIWCAV